MHRIEDLEVCSKFAMKISTCLVILNWNFQACMNSHHIFVPINLKPPYLLRITIPGAAAQAWKKLSALWQVTKTTPPSHSPAACRAAPCWGPQTPWTPPQHRWTTASYEETSQRCSAIRSSWGGGESLRSRNQTPREPYALLPSMQSDGAQGPWRNEQNIKTNNSNN